MTNATKPIAYVTLHKARKVMMPFVWYGSEKCNLWRWPWENAREFSSDIHDYEVKYVKMSTNPMKKTGDALTLTAAQLAYVTATFSAADRKAMHAWSDKNKDVDRSDAEKNVRVLRKAAKLDD